MPGFNLPPENAKKLAAVIRDVAMNPMNAHFHAVREIVKTRGVEPKSDKIAKTLSVMLGNGVEVSVQSPKSQYGHGISIVRWNGAIVLHQCDAMGQATYLPGDWEDEVTAALRQIEGEHLAETRKQIEHNRTKVNNPASN